MTRRFANMAYPRPRPWRWYDTLTVCFGGFIGSAIILMFIAAILLTGRH